MHQAGGSPPRDSNQHAAPVTAGPLRMTEQMTVTRQADVRRAIERFTSRRQQPDAFALEAARPVRADKRPKAAE